MEVWLCEIGLRAERKAGLLLREMEKAKGTRGNPGGRGAPIVQSSDTAAQLKALEQHGITRDQSSRWQKLAEVPDGTHTGRRWRGLIGWHGQVRKTVRRIGERSPRRLHELVVKIKPLIPALCDRIRPTSKPRGKLPLPPISGRFMTRRLQTPAYRRAPLSFCRPLLAFEFGSRSNQNSSLRPFGLPAWSHSS